MKTNNNNSTFRSNFHFTVKWYIIQPSTLLTKLLRLNCLKRNCYKMTDKMTLKEWHKRGLNCNISILLNSTSTSSIFFSGLEETVRVVALDRSFHVKCYQCEDCGLLLSSGAEGHGCYPLDDHVLCKQCNTRRIQLLTQKI